MFSKFGLYGIIFKAAQATFIIHNSANQEDRDKAIQIIREKQEYAQKTPGAMPLGIFPEGAMTNNRYLMPFKKGAFESGMSIRPLVIKYKYELISS